MPCSPGMKRCRRDCLHRRLVGDYHVARHSQILAEEAATHGDPWMIAARHKQGQRPIIFKEWLQGSGRVS
jgi:hypothetical protein